MSPYALSGLPTRRIFATLMALVILMAGQGVHATMVQADTEVGAPHAMSGPISNVFALNMSEVVAVERQLESEPVCVGTERGSCAATVPPSPPGLSFLQGLPSDHAVVNSAVRLPERLFRPPIRLS